MEKDDVVLAVLCCLLAARRKLNLEQQKKRAIRYVASESKSRNNSCQMRSTFEL